MVAQDGSGDFTSVKVACDTAVAGDSVFVHNGYYEHSYEISVKSGVVVYPETHGGVTIANFLTQPNNSIVQLHGSAEIIGLSIIGDPFAILQDLVRVYGGPARIYNCEFTPRRNGSQIWLQCQGVPANISQCFFGQPFGHFIYNSDSTDIAMPYNCFNWNTDTARIHNAIRDGRDSPFTDGMVYISPVLDTFQCSRSAGKYRLHFCLLITI